MADQGAFFFSEPLPAESEQEILAHSVEEEEQAEVPATKAELESDGQIPLMDIGTWWEEHWKQMPEFVQKDLEPFHTIYVHFESREDMERFAELVGQTVLTTTRSIWYPEAEIGRFAHKRFIDAP
jgi:hypothetical protein